MVPAARQENPEWRREADAEPYRIEARLGRDGRVSSWHVYDCRDEDGGALRQFRSRDTALAYADQMNAEHRRWFR